MKRKNGSTLFVEHDKVYSSSYTDQSRSVGKFVSAVYAEVHAQLVLRLLYVCHICLFVCSSAFITCALSYIVTLLCQYSHEHSGSYLRFAGPIGVIKPREVVGISEQVQASIHLAT